jgi:hypothetical protein
MRSRQALAVSLSVSFAASSALAQTPPPPKDAAPDSAPAAAPAAEQGDKEPEVPTLPFPKAAVDPATASQQPAASQTQPEEAPPFFIFSHPFAWPQTVERIAVTGYVLPQFEYVSLPYALPRDQRSYGAKGSRAGFAIHGTPFEAWSYILHAVVTPAGTESITILSPTTATSTPLVVTTSNASVGVEEGTITYRPVSWFQAKGGALRIPFTLGQVTPIPEQMFPIRPAETLSFQNGPDVGFLVTVAPFDARLQANVGIFDGLSLPVSNSTQTLRGVAFAGSLEAHPLGAMAMREGDPDRGPFRFAVGVGSILHEATAFDTTGYEATHIQDLRLDISLRASFKGLFFQGEYMRHLQTDDLTGRPILDSGAYAEASYYQPIGKVAFGPLLRVGQLATTVEFAESKFTSVEGALAFYPKADLKEPERLRIIAEYLNASIAPLTEIEREGLIQVQLGW